MMMMMMMMIFLLSRFAAVRTVVLTGATRTPTSCAVIELPCVRFPGGAVNRARL